MKIMCVMIHKGQPSQKCWDSLEPIRTSYPDAVSALATENVYATKNVAINLAREKGAKYLFLIEDCVIVKDCSVFEQYVDLLKKWDALYASYSFCGPFNRVMNSKPNPGVILTTDWGVLHFGKHFCDKFMVINVEKLGAERFNESMDSLSREEFSNRVKQKALQPFNGFFFDVIDSWKYFEDDIAAGTYFNPKIFQENAVKDSKYLKENNIELKIDFSVDTLVQWVKEKIAKG